MNPAELMALAEQAGMYSGTMGEVKAGPVSLGRFAALVAAAERDACAVVVEGFGGNGPGYIDDDWARMAAAAIRKRGTP